MANSAEPCECFRLRFQKRLNDYQANEGSIAEGFGLVWEKTLEEVPVDDDVQGELYRELINWAGGDKLFTGGGNPKLLGAWREAVHEF